MANRLNSRHSNTVTMLREGEGSGERETGRDRGDEEGGVGGEREGGRERESIRLRICFPESGRGEGGREGEREKGGTGERERKRACVRTHTHLMPKKTHTCGQP